MPTSFRQIIKKSMNENRSFNAWHKTIQNNYEYLNREYKKLGLSKKLTMGITKFNSYEVWLNIQKRLVDEALSDLEQQKSFKVCQLLFNAKNCGHLDECKYFTSRFSVFDRSEEELGLAVGPDLKSASEGMKNQVSVFVSDKKLVLDTVNIIREYDDWLDMEKKRMALALGAELQIQGILGAEKRKELIDRINGAVKETEGRVNLLALAIDGTLELNRTSEKKRDTKREILNLAHKYNFNRTRRTLVAYSTKDAIRDITRVENRLVERLDKAKVGPQSMEIVKKTEDMAEDLVRARSLKPLLRKLRQQKGQLKFAQGLGVEMLQDLSDDIKAMNQEFVQGIQSLAKIWREMKHDGGDEDIVKFGVKPLIEDQVSEQIMLLEKRDLLNLELRQLKKARKSRMRKGMNIYCGFSGVSFPLLVVIGKLIAGDCGGVKSRSVIASGPVAFGTLEALSKASDSPISLFGLGGLGADMGKLAKCRDINTGEFTISMNLGLGMGLSEAATLGITLVYTAKINISDDRRFRASSTVSIHGKMEAGDHRVLSAVAEMDFVSSTTVFVFNDVYHWAAWLAQKWGNLAAWTFALGCNPYKRNKTQMPTKEELDFMSRLVDVYSEANPRIKKNFDKLKPFLVEPVVRCKKYNALSDPSISVTVGKYLGAGLGGSGFPRISNRFYRRYTEDGRLVEEVKKDPLVYSVSGNVGIPQIKCDVGYTFVGFDPNPDNDGHYVNFKVELMSKPDPPPDEIENLEIPQWAEELADKMGKMDHESFGEKGLWPKKGIMGFARSQNLAKFEINCLAQKVGNRRMLAIQYIRGILEFELEKDAEVETGVPGLEVLFGGSIALTRTFGEFIMPFTMSYLKTVYNGYKLVLKNEEREKDGEHLWKKFKKNHQQELKWFKSMIRREKSWVRRELDEEEGAVGMIAKRLIGTAEKGTKFDVFLSTLEHYLDENHKQWQKDRQKGWKRITKQEENIFVRNVIRKFTSKGLSQKGKALRAAKDFV